ncbi:hypothetical protein HNQ02_001133 [Flavobacterium sp. 7E]|uniref:hypothetical protein n=1 Tax=Flavobacterium sp. 7E TaxID=2735898 RepID=UPI00156FB593|nr:hypothetical protein [Flavobacterium sp. 7E]NRS88219.1 hypothetical protein [Flavobacterium sp. 7E]
MKFIKMVSILKNNENFTPYVFYSSFLKEVAEEIKNEDFFIFKFVENGDENVFDSNYRIEPISIPLLLSLSEQLSKFYKEPIELLLYKNNATKEVLNFLFKSDFFWVAGDNKIPSYPLGRNILNFENSYLGDFIKNDPRPDHRVRCYSLNDDDLQSKLDDYKGEDEKRDFLISEYVYTVREHFQELLFDNTNTSSKTDYYVELLSELITNGVLHSKSNTFALMFLNKFSTKFSISDNGIGFQESLNSKAENFLYKPFELKNKIEGLNILKVNSKILNNLHVIFETLYYSSLKDRRGLFDLMISVVLESKGYFRLHSDNSQIIVSNRMNNELIELSNLRNKLFNFHEKILVNAIKDSRYDDDMISVQKDIMSCFVRLYKNICDKYNNDYRYSSIRFYNVKFKGVHIEVEIPNT